MSETDPSQPVEPAADAPVEPDPLVADLPVASEEPVPADPGLPVEGGFVSTGPDGDPPPLSPEALAAEPDGSENAPAESAPEVVPPSTEPSGDAATFEPPVAPEPRPPTTTQDGITTVVEEPADGTGTVAVASALGEPALIEAPFATTAEGQTVTTSPFAVTEQTPQSAHPAPTVFDSAPHDVVLDVPGQPPVFAPGEGQTGDAQPPEPDPEPDKTQTPGATVGPGDADHALASLWIQSVAEVCAESGIAKGLLVQAVEQGYANLQGRRQTALALGEPDPYPLLAV